MLLCVLLRVLILKQKFASCFTEVNVKTLGKNCLALCDGQNFEKFYVQKDEIFHNFC